MYSKKYIHGAVARKRHLIGVAHHLETDGGPPQRGGSLALDCQPYRQMWCTCSITPYINTNSYDTLHTHYYQYFYMHFYFWLNLAFWLFHYSGVEPINLGRPKMIPIANHFPNNTLKEDFTRGVFPKKAPTPPDPKSATSHGSSL